ncbi:MAG TPA: hypothetical protein DIU00_17580 [Phycisphaerales bacterium]|nr:hypothetical protein [Phycisphaerales bacterium]
MSRTLITGFVFLAVTIFAVFMIFGTGIHPDGFNAAKAAVASEPGVAGGRDSLQSELQELLMERRRILSGIVESMKIFLESGRGDIEEYRDANIALLRAEMDLCTTPNERIEILQKIVQFHKKFEEQIKRRADEGHTTQYDVDRAKVAMLEAQIELVRENLKVQSTN